MLLPPRLPSHVIRELAVRAKTDPRTVTAVYREPATADRNASRARAADELRAAGYLPAPASAA